MKNIKTPAQQKEIDTYLNALGKAIVDGINKGKKTN